MLFYKITYTYVRRIPCLSRKQKVKLYFPVIQGKAMAEEDLYSSARLVMDKPKQGMSHLCTTDPILDENVLRTLNRHRQTRRPDEPIDMSFEVSYNICLHLHVDGSLGFTFNDHLHAFYSDVHNA